MTDCVFCAIVAGESPAEVVHETDDTIAFLDIAPWTRGHTLVVPREHHDDWWDVPRSLAGAVAEAAHDVAGLARQRLDAEGVNLFQATRRIAWQTVFHLHVHVVPRWADDGLPAPHRWIDHAEDHDRAAVAARLRGDATG